MNQFANIFLSFYLLFLACMPCHDTAEKVDNIAQTVVRIYTDSQASHSADSDFCSPLCSCACCGTLMISPYFTQMPVFRAIYGKLKFSSETKDTSGFISLLWQPPQLV
jgi:hypothetical protein